MNNKNHHSNSQSVNHNPNTNGAPTNTNNHDTSNAEPSTTTSSTATVPSVITPPVSPSPAPAPAPVGTAAPPPLPPVLASCLSLVEQAKTVHDTTNPPGILDSTEKRGMLKMPKKGVAQVIGLATLWQKYGGTLAGVNLSLTTQQLAHAQSVREVWRAAQELTKSLDDDAFTSESSVWTQATQIYTMLDTMARTNKALATALEPFAQYFSEGAQTRKQDKADKLPTKKERRKQRVATKAIEAAAKLGINLGAVATTTDHGTTPSTGAASNGATPVHTA